MPDKFVHNRGLALPLLSVLVLSACGGGDGNGSPPATRDAGVYGSILIASGSRVDRDYADLWAFQGERWPADRDEPVLLPLPSTAAGYLSASAGRYPGNPDFRFPIDTSDIYRADILQGDNLYIQVFPSLQDAGPIDLAILVDGVEVCSGDGCYSGEPILLGLSSEASVSNIEIRLESGGPLRYVLTIAVPGETRNTEMSWQEPALNTGHAIVTETGLSAKVRQLTGGAVPMTVTRELGPKTFLVRMPESFVSQAATGLDSDDARSQTVEWIDRIKHIDGLMAEPDYLVRSQSISPQQNPAYARPELRWNLDQIGIEQAWTETGGRWGQRVGVAVMDTGLLSTDPSAFGGWHPDLDAGVVDRGGILDFVSGEYDTDSEPGRDANPATPIGFNGQGTSFHGTHVAGILGARDNNAGSLGVAHEVNLIPYRVLGVDPVSGEAGMGTASDLIDAIYNAGRRDDVDVINLSLGGIPPLAALQDATDFAFANGIFVVAAAGNSGSASETYPAANSKVVGVGAVTSEGTLAEYSNFGPSVNLVAPGGGLTGLGIFSAWGSVSDSRLSVGYSTLVGTSMAAPHVAGVYALQKSLANGLGREWTPAHFWFHLISGNLTRTGPPLNAQSYTAITHGAGLMDAPASVRAVSMPVTSAIAATPRVVFLSSQSTSRSVGLDVYRPEGGPEPVLTEISATPGWLDVTTGSGDRLVEGELVPSQLRLTLDVQGVPSGRLIEEEFVLNYDDGRTLTIPVVVLGADGAGSRDAGRHYVLLLDAERPLSGRSLQTTASYESGQYRFSFPDVEPGQYYLVAGSDLDNNGFICENGEACAEYPVTGSRELVTVREGQAVDLEITTAFRRPVISSGVLPRYGFQGYRIKSEKSVSTPDRKLAP